MSEDRFDEELALNRRAYAELRDQIRREYAGKYVGLAFGRVMAVGDYDAVTTEMDALDPRPACALVFPAEDEPLFDPPEAPPYYEFAD
jgi:hypothetical protein